MYGIHKVYRNTQRVACLFNILSEGHHNFLKIEMSFSNIGDFKKIWNCTKTIFLCALCIAPPPPFPRDLSVALVGADFFFSPELRQDAPLKKVEEVLRREEIQCGLTAVPWKRTILFIWMLFAEVGRVPYTYLRCCHPILRRRGGTFARGESERGRPRCRNRKYLLTQCGQQTHAAGEEAGKRGGGI